MLTQTLIDQYLAAKTNSWSPTSLRSEGFRLKALLPLGELAAEPLKLYNELKTTYKPYTLKTVFIRLTDFMTWAYNKSLIPANPYPEFMSLNRNLFKNAYKSEKVDVSYEEALSRINKLTDKQVRVSALALLKGGLRAHELHRINGTEVTGKGGKVRPLMIKAPAEGLSEYSKLYGELKKIGLKPHTLRKLFATKLVESGISPQDLCEIMGWESFTTAQRYLQPQSENKLRAFVKAAIKA